MTNYTMYDAADPTGIPGDARIVAGYVDGKWPWTAGDWDRWPSQTRGQLHISVLADPAADTFDVENGNASPAAVAGALRVRGERGERSVVYCSTASYPGISARLADAGIKRSSWDWWAARWGEGEDLPDGAVALQFEAVTAYDVSVVDSVWALARWPQLGKDSPDTPVTVVSHPETTETPLKDPLLVAMPPDGPDDILGVIPNLGGPGCYIATRHGRVYNIDGAPHHGDYTTLRADQQTGAMRFVAFSAETWSNGVSGYLLIGSAWAGSSPAEQVFRWNGSTSGR